MKYCETCRVLCVSGSCPICENLDLRDVRVDDFCLLTECTDSFGKMLEFTLSEMNIKCVLVPFGNGAKSALGLKLGYCKVYVLYQHYAAAKDIVEELTYNPTDDLRKDLLANEESWYVKSKSALKKMRKKLRLSENQDLLACVKEAVLKASEISDDGVISSCTKGGHYISIKINDKKVWFNSATYEIFM